MTCTKNLGRLCVHKGLSPSQLADQQSYLLVVYLRILLKEVINIGIMNHNCLSSLDSPCTNRLLHSQRWYNIHVHMYNTSKIMKKLLTLHLAQCLRCDIVNVYLDPFFPSVLLAQFQQVKLAPQI